MLISRSSEYAIELVLYLINQNSDTFIPLHQIAKDTNLSYHFLGKISQILVKNDLLKTYRGPNGGVTLNRLPSEISLYDVVSAVEGDAFLDQCMLRPQRCSDDSPCQIHPVWANIRTDIQNVFHNVTLDTFTRNDTEL
ncbi:MAG: Rrf2 family transcriptional regulator [Candidatus Marinimicrobia bacterium]|nr:Rrf2 family transcriptional regulator [Candidatus Neomarinimicrobiota bacterium]